MTLPNLSLLTREREIKGEVVDERKIQSKREKSSESDLVNLDGSPAGVRRSDPHEILIPVGSSEH